MIQIITFCINAIIYFINSLRSISVPELGISILAFFIGLKVLDIIYGSILRLFGIEKRKIQRTYTNKFHQAIYRRKLKTITKRATRTKSSPKNNLRIGG